MRRALLWISLLALALVLAATALVSLRAAAAPPLPPPDARMPIELPRGGSLPLGDLLARLRREPGPVQPLVPTEPGGIDDGGEAPPPPLDEAERLADGLYVGMDWGPVFKLAEHHRQAGRTDQALALFQSVAPGDPDYGRAQRRIAWSILTWERDQPAAAVPYAHRALLAEPGDGNGWQDLARIYTRTLGVPVD